MLTFSLATEYKNGISIYRADIPADTVNVYEARTVYTNNPDGVTVDPEHGNILTSGRTYLKAYEGMSLSSKTTLCPGLDCVELDALTHGLHKNYLTTSR